MSCSLRVRPNSASTPGNGSNTPTIGPLIPPGTQADPPPRQGQVEPPQPPPPVPLGCLHFGASKMRSINTNAKNIWLSCQNLLKPAIRRRLFPFRRQPSLIYFFWSPGAPACAIKSGLFPRPPAGSASLISAPSSPPAAVGPAFPPNPEPCCSRPGFPGSARNHSTLPPGPALSSSEIPRHSPHDPSTTAVAAESAAPGAQIFVRVDHHVACRCHHPGTRSLFNRLAPP